MIPDKFVELIHRVAFERASDKEKQELAALIAKNPEARALYDDLVSMARLFAEGADLPAPPNLKKRVMNLVDAKRCVGKREASLSRSDRKKGGVVMGDLAGRGPISRRTGWLIGGAVAVVVIVLVIAFTSQSPSDRDVKGTIGGAEKAAKYRSGQIGNADVILENPEFQQILQNDKVQDLVRSPEFQKLMSDPAVVALLNDGAFVALMSDEKFLNALGDGAFTAMMDNAKCRQALEAQESQIAQVMSEQTFAEMMGAMPKQMAEALNDAAFAAFMASPKAAAVMRDAPAQFAEVLGDKAVIRLVMNDTFRSLAASEPAIAAFMSDPQVMELMSNQTFVAQASAAKSLNELKSNAVFAQVMNNQAYAALGSGPKAAKTSKMLRSADFAALMSSSAYRQMQGAQAKQLAEVLSDRATMAFLDAPKIQMALGDRPWRFLRLMAEPKIGASMVGSRAVIAQLANEPAFIALMNNATYRAALASHQAEMAQMLSNATFRQAVASSATSLMAAMSNPTIRATMLSETKMPEMMANQAFIRIMSEPKLRQQFYDAMPKITR